jgi:hypothetical protein
MTAFGDIYYEGKENDIRSKNFKPGKLSDILRVLKYKLINNNRQLWE